MLILPYHRVSLRNLCLFRLFTNAGHWRKRSRVALHMRGSTGHNQNQNNSSESEANTELSKSRCDVYATYTHSITFIQTRKGRKDVGDERDHKVFLLLLSQS